MQRMAPKLAPTRSVEAAHIVFVQKLLFAVSILNRNSYQSSKTSVQDSQKMPNQLYLTFPTHPQLLEAKELYLQGNQVSKLYGVFAITYQCTVITRQLYIK